MERRYIYSGRPQRIQVGRQIYDTLDLALLALEKIHKDKVRGQRSYFVSGSEENRTEAAARKRKQTRGRRR